MKRILITFIALMAIASGAQAQVEKTIIWDEDFINSIQLTVAWDSENRYYAVKKNAEKDDIQLDLSCVQSFESFKNGNIDLSPGSSLYFTYTEGTFKKIVIHYSNTDTRYPNSSKVGWENVGQTYVCEPSRNPSRVNIDGMNNEYYGAHILGITKIEFTVLTDKFIITDIPEGWTVNNETPSNGMVKLPFGSQINVTLGNIPVGKRVKSIKLIPVE